MSLEANIKGRDSLELCSVMDLCNECEQGIKKFRVAFYQRGYRWKNSQVRQLLDDIDSFSPTHKASFYFLQALVVSKNKDGLWNIVDGQQRLTTIALIQSTLGTVNPITLRYERDAANDMAGTIDTHYRSEAKKTIHKWVEGKTDIERKAFAEKLNKAKFLLYCIQNEDELAVFGRLNSGKIGAQDSELVKCVMLTPLLDEPATVTQARAREWDEIDRALTDNQFFSFFVRRDTWGEGDRMAMLFCRAGLCTQIEEAKKNEVFPFLNCVQDAIGASSRSEVWQKIYFTFYTLAAWYNDPVMYHAVGWYIHREGEMSCLKMALDDVRAVLTKSLSNTEGCIPKQSELDRDKGLDFYNIPQAKAQAREYLLLYNVAFCWRRWPMRYDFHQHRQVDSWSLEHIVARNTRDLTEVEFENFSPQEIKKADWGKYEEACKIKQGEAWLIKILPQSYPNEDDHNIQNLALLSTNANASLNNNLFEGKRRLILGWFSSDKDNYWVPPATQAIFFKTIPDTDPRTPYWSQTDKQKYVESMQKDVHAFVTAVKGVF